PTLRMDQPGPSQVLHHLGQVIRHHPRRLGDLANGPRLARLRGEIDHGPQRILGRSREHGPLEKTNNRILTSRKSASRLSTRHWIVLSEIRRPARSSGLAVARL